MDRFSYLISDGHQNVLAIKVYQLDAFNDYNSAFKDSLQKIFLSDALLKLPYHQVRLGIGGTMNVLVPEVLYHPGQKHSYLEQLTEITSEEEVFTDELSKFKAKNVYLVNKDTIRLLKSYFVNASFYHATTPVLHGFQRIAEHVIGSALYLNVIDKHLHIAVFENGQLHFSNIFNFKSSRDFIYYVMLVYDQFKLKPETIPVYIAGQIVDDSEIYHLLYRYVRHLNMVQAPDYLQFDVKHNSLNAHFYFDLYSMRLCE